MEIRNLAQMNYTTSWDWSVLLLRNQCYLKRISAPGPATRAPTCWWWRCLGSRMLLDTALLGGWSRVLRWCFTCLGLKTQQNHKPEINWFIRQWKVQDWKVSQVGICEGKSLCKILSTLIKVWGKNQNRRRMASKWQLNTTTLRSKKPLKIYSCFQHVLRSRFLSLNAVFCLESSKHFS